MHKMADDLQICLQFTFFFSMTLKPYQMIGLNWLTMMHTQELNGILGDEMVRI